MQELGRAVHVNARVYLTDGATAVLYGWRETTIDVDVKLVPDSDEIVRETPRLKEELNLNVELAAPLGLHPPTRWMGGPQSPTGALSSTRSSPSYIASQRSTQPRFASR
jgi:hypothetical protein